MGLGGAKLSRKKIVEDGENTFALITLYGQFNRCTTNPISNKAILIGEEHIDRYNRSYFNPRPPGGGRGVGSDPTPSLFLDTFRGVTDINAKLRIPSRTTISHRV